MFLSKEFEEEYYQALRLVHGVKFTQRQVDVLSCIANGRVKHLQIANILDVSVTVISSHLVSIRERIAQKPGAGNDILSFIEQSTNYQQIREHYCFLLQYKKFQEALRHISRKIGTKSNLKIIIFYLDAKDTRFLLEDTRFGLIKHLGFLDIEVEKCNIGDYTKRNKLNDRLDDSRIIFILSKSFHTKASTSDFHKKSLDILFKSISHTENKVICINTNSPKVEEKSTKSFEILKDARVIDGGTNFYNVFFNLLEELSILTTSESERFIKAISDVKKIPLLLERDHDEIAVSNKSILFEKIVKNKVFLFLLTVLVLIFISGIALSNLLGKSNITIEYDHSSLVNTKSWNIPIESNQFINRPIIMSNLKNKLPIHNKKSSLNIVGLYGLGGAGKTSLANRIINKPHKKYEFRGWFSAGTRELIQNDYFALGRSQNLFHKGMTIKDKIDAVKNWMMRQEKILLVYDDVPEIELLTHYLPNIGDVVITSRNYKMPNAIEVDTMQEDEAIELLEGILSQGNNQQKQHNEEVKALARILGYLPLALSQAGAYIEQNKLDIGKYLKLFKNQKHILLQEYTMQPLDSHLPAYITWDISFKQLLKEKGAEDIIKLLEFISCCDPDNIQKKLLAQYLYKKDDDLSLLKLNKLLNQIRKYSLIKLNEQSISIHSIVHDWLENRLGKQYKIGLLKNYIAIVNDIYVLNKSSGIFPKLHKVSLKDIQDIVPQIMYLKNQLLNLSMQKELIEIDDILCNIHYIFGEYNTSLKLAQKVYNYRKLNTKQEDISISAILYKIGALHYELRNPKDSIYFLTQALAIKEKYILNSPDGVSCTMYQLARAYYFVGDIEKSRKLFERNLKLKEKILGKDHYEICDTKYYLGMIYLDLGYDIPGRTLIESVIKEDRAKLDKNRKECSKIMFRLASCYMMIGDLEKSISYLEECLRMKRSILQDGQDSLAVKDIYNLMCKIFLESENYSKSIVYGNKSLALADKFGIEDAYPLHYLGLAYQKSGDYKRSQKYLNQALKIHEKLSYKDSYHLGSILFELGKVKYLLAEYEESHELLEKSIKIHKKYFKQDHPKLKRVVHQLMVTDQKLDETSKLKKK